MNKILDTIIGSVEEKKEWWAMEARAKKLPHDYRVVYGKIKQYIWKSSGVSTINVFKVLLDLFEESSADGRRVLEITGDNVAMFCDELVRDEKSYFENLRKRLNYDVMKKLGKKKKNQT